MKDGLRFVDCDMHIMEPVDLFDRYLDKRFKDRVTSVVGPDGKPRRGTIVIDGLPTTMDAEMQQYRKRGRPGAVVEAAHRDGRARYHRARGVDHGHDQPSVLRGLGQERDRPCHGRTEDGGLENPSEHPERMTQDG